jgi:hypothetical protein
MKEEMRTIALTLAALAVSLPAYAAGIDSRAYTCAELQSLIASYGYVFIGNPDFQDFVVADESFCSGGSIVRPRSVATRDLPECPVRYCVPVSGRVP